MDSFVDIRCRGNVITELSFSNGRPLWLQYSDFQAVLTGPLPSNGHIRRSVNVPKLTQQMGVSYGSTRIAQKKHLQVQLYMNSSLHEWKGKNNSSVLNIAHGLET
jgi:hypothetical protein